MIGVLRPGTTDESSLDEMDELLRTAGVVAVGRITQRLGRPHPRSYVGPGKLEEVRLAIDASRADVLVCDDELSPAQQRYLEDRLEVRVVDRTAVILDIFASHAHTAEGKLQVELAQLEYNLQRMRGMWKHLERLGGGVGTRGPGESQLETDRRLARERIVLLRGRLREVGKHRARIRERREHSEMPAVALAGYTNVGKSTLLNALTGSRVSAANRLFQTLDPTTRTYDHAGRAYSVTDTVGFIRKLPHSLVESFASTLEETLAGDLVLFVADGSAEEAERAAQEVAVDSVFDEIGAADVPRLRVLNKIDLLDGDDRRRLANANPDAILVSAVTGQGLDELRERIARHFASRFQRVDLVVPHGEGAALASLYALGAPLEREDHADGVHVRAHLPAAEARRYERFRVHGVADSRPS